VDAWATRAAKAAMRKVEVGNFIMEALRYCKILHFFATRGELQKWVKTRLAGVPTIKFLKFRIAT
jgi:hypothetical protein